MKKRLLSTVIALLMLMQGMGSFPIRAAEVFDDGTGWEIDLPEEDVSIEDGTRWRTVYQDEIIGINDEDELVEVLPESDIISKNENFTQDEFQIISENTTEILDYYQVDSSTGDEIDAYIEADLQTKVIDDNDWEVNSLGSNDFSAAVDAGFDIFNGWYYGVMWSDGREKSLEEYYRTLLYRQFADQYDRNTGWEKFRKSVQKAWTTVDGSYFDQKDFYKIFLLKLVSDDYKGFNLSTDYSQEALKSSVSALKASNFAFISALKASNLAFISFLNASNFASIFSVNSLKLFIIIT